MLVRASVLTYLLVNPLWNNIHNWGESGRTSNCRELGSREEIARFLRKGGLPLRFGINKKFLTPFNHNPIVAGIFMKKEQKYASFSLMKPILPKGLPRNDHILISGTPGSGKSILSLQFIYEGAQLGEKGIYVTLDSKREYILEQASQFGMDFGKLISEGKAEVLHLDPTDIYAFLDDLKNKASEMGAERIVLDSLSVLSVYCASYRNLPEDLMDFLQSTKYVPPIIDSSSMKKQMLYQVLSTLRELNCTTLLISELPKESNWFSRDTVSEFSSDGIILLEYHILGATGASRSLSVVKMRRSKYAEGVHEFTITDKGIKILQ